MAVQPAKGRPENSMLNKMDIVLEMSAYKLDPRTFQRFEPVGKGEFGMSIGQD